MAGARAARGTGGSGCFRATSPDAIGCGMGRASRRLDAPQRAGGRGPHGRLPRTQGRRAARMANHLAWLATFDVDVPRIRNAQTFMKKMWVMTMRERRAPVPFQLHHSGLGTG